MPITSYEDGTITDCPASPGGRIPRKGGANGRKHKTFELNGASKRRIRCSAIRLKATAKNKVLVPVLTFPEDVEEPAANRCFSNLIDNLKTNFDLHSYLAVKELTKIGRPHFHLFLDIPYTPFKVLNQAWCSSFRHLMPSSDNALTTGPNPILSDVQDAVLYVTKYITKAEVGQKIMKPETRQYFISRNVLSRPAMITDSMLTYLLIKYAHDCYESDFFTWYRLHGYNVLPEIELNKMQKILDSRPDSRPDSLSGDQLEFNDYVDPVDGLRNLRHWEV